MKKYLLAASSYKHLEFYNRIMTLKTVIIGLYVGFLAGILISFYNKVYLGSFVRRLVKKEVFSPEKALTLDEIGMKNTFFLRRALIKGGTLRRIAEAANEDEATCETERSKAAKWFRKFFRFENTPKVKYDFEKLKFYIPEEKKYAAEIRYEKKGSNPAMFIIMAIALTVVAVVAYIEIPELLTLLDNFLTSVIRE